MDGSPSLSFNALGAGMGEEMGLGMSMGEESGAGKQQNLSQQRQQGGGVGGGAPFLVLTGGGATGGPRGSMLVDGPMPSSTPARQPAQSQAQTRSQTQSTSVSPPTSQAPAAPSPQTPPKPTGNYTAAQVHRQGSTRASDVSSSNSASDVLAASTSSASRASTWMSASASAAPLLPTRGSPSPGPGMNGPSGIGGQGPNSGFTSPFARPGTRPNAALFNAISSSTYASMPNSASGSGFGMGSGSGSRGSMILYRLSAGEDGVLGQHNHARGADASPPHFYTPGMVRAPPGSPPGLPHTHAPPTPPWHRNSAYSSSDGSVLLDGDTKYPTLSRAGSAFGLGVNGSASPSLALDSVALGMRAGTAEVGTVGRSQGGLVAYVWDPDEEDEEDEDEGEQEKWMHDPSTVNALYSAAPYVKGTGAGVTPGKGAGTGQAVSGYRPPKTVSVRGLFNVTSLVALILGLLSLFIILPIFKVYSDNGVQAKILGNTRINATGQAVSRREVWDGLDVDIPVVEWGREV